MTTLPPEPEDRQPAGAAGEAVPVGSAGPDATSIPPAAPAAPQAPPAGAYQAPPGYQAPPAGAYQQPQQSAAPQQGMGSDPASTITLNYWLSVFFTWVPALIFYIIEKDKGNARSFEFHRENLNFSLLRTGVWLATWLLTMILPFPIDVFLGGILWIGSLVLFVFHLIAAVKAPEAFRSGRRPEFIFNIPLIK